jgi:hypothetical protein
MKHWAFYMMEPHISLCLTGLKDIDKNIANGEILGVTLLMEDLLSSKVNDLEEDDEDEAVANPADPNSQKALAAKKEQAKLALASIQQTPSSNLPLMANYRRWRNFMLIWKRIELLKVDWGRRKLGVEEINTPELYSTYW